MRHADMHWWTENLQQFILYTKATPIQAVMITMLIHYQDYYTVVDMIATQEEVTFSRPWWKRFILQKQKKIYSTDCAMYKVSTKYRIAVNAILQNDWFVAHKAVKYMINGSLAAEETDAK